MESVSDISGNYIFCNNHNLKLAKKYCEQCNIFICNGCALDDHSTHFEKLNKITNLYSNKSSILQKFLNFNNDKMKGGAFIKCMNFVFHEGSHYCKECKNFICSKCLISHETGHSIILVSDYIPFLKEKVEFLIKFMDSGFNFRFTKLKNQME